MSILKKIDDWLCKLENWKDNLSHKERECVYIIGCLFTICFLICGLILSV